mmetsp:Transcript_8175/g.34346  ORF Transcript_8175/g.34346 Transcript_8175/m.34346 type:complete len:208 (-) Transcript_8175:153-776(-)
MRSLMSGLSFLAASDKRETLSGPPKASAADNCKRERNSSLHSSILQSSARVSRTLHKLCAVSVVLLLNHTSATLPLSFSSTPRDLRSLDSSCASAAFAATSLHVLSMRSSSPSLSSSPALLDSGPSQPCTHVSPGPSYERMILLGGGRLAPPPAWKVGTGGALRLAVAAAERRQASSVPARTHLPQGTASSHAACASRHGPHALRTL